MGLFADALPVKFIQRAHWCVSPTCHHFCWITQQISFPAGHRQHHCTTCLPPPSKAICRAKDVMAQSSSMLFFLLLEALVVRSSPPGCASCGLLGRDAEERLMVEMAKQQLLDKLHLKEAPRISQTVPRVALLTALRKLQSGRVSQDGTLELDNSVAVKDQGYEIISFADRNENNHEDKTNLTLTFQFLQEHGHSVQVLRSSLWVYVRSSKQPFRVPARVFLTADGGAWPPNRTLVMEKMLEVQESNWHTFPISRTLQAFLDGGQKRLRLEVICKEDGRNLCAPENSPDTPFRPFLVAQVRLRDDPAKHLLRKRSLRCGDDVTVCCKRDFYIKFKDIQWHDWIIAPEGYHMNYCLGQCPQHLSGSPGIASSFHATVLSQLKVNGINTAASSCCVPTERQPLSMVFFNSQHNIVKTDIPDMIVESCGCT
ncbi:inhibin beta C chain [Entelurus aequoreus]|uniref:inhibin beta C chain n=1 Tax=Entelurus aequoreus TaxID=161455 RepID=UPI002B1E8541|nr:inhibin beta C chain [Entelurus aequoreus]